MLKRTFAAAKAKQVKRVGVCLDLAKPLDIYDLRKSLFGRLISAEKKIPLQAFYYTRKDARDLETQNREFLEKLDFRFDKEVELSQDKLEKEIATTINILEERDIVRHKENGYSTYSMGESKITVKDMRVGEFQYNLAENLKSPIIQIRKDGLYTPNFLFTCQDANLEDLVLVENDIDFMDSVKKLCFLYGEQRNSCRFLHLSVVTGVLAMVLTRSNTTSLQYFMNEVGIDKLALLSYIGHLGCVYSTEPAPRDPFVALKAKMMSLKEMTEKFKVDLLQNEPCLFAHEELQQMNKFFLRNRINVCEKPSQKAYLDAIIGKWGGPKLLKRLTNEYGELDKELLKEALWEAKTFADIKELGAIFDHGPSKILADESLKSKLQLPGVEELLSKLAAEARPFFSRHSFESKNIGKLISTLLMGQKTPDKVFGSVEALLFGKTDHIGILVKAKLVGQEEFLRRIELTKALSK